MQALDEVADHHAQAVELLEHRAELLAGALAHVGVGLVRLLPDDVGGDGGAHVHDLCALADDIGVVWAHTDKDKETDQRAETENVSQIDTTTKYKQFDFPFSSLQPCDDVV